MVTGKPTGKDGSNGRHMQNEVTKKIQKKYGLPQTGEVDALTYGYVVSEIKDADTSVLDKQIASMESAFKTIYSTAKKYA